MAEKKFFTEFKAMGTDIFAAINCGDKNTRNWNSKILNQKSAFLKIVSVGLKRQ